MIFKNRIVAGQQLAKSLKGFEDVDAIIIALPRGGVVLAAEVARQLDKPLQILLTKKITLSGQPEYAIGALVVDQEAVYDQAVIKGIPKQWLKIAEKETQELLSKRQKSFYPKLDYTTLKGKTLIVVDDGLATGLTMKAALVSLNKAGAKEIIVATAVASVEAIDDLEKLCDEIIVLDDPFLFLGSVGAHYQDFEQVSDQEVEQIITDLS